MAEHGRHNFDIKSMTATGNVIHKCKSINPSLASDFHMHLSVANLFDCFTADGEYKDASLRPWGSEKERHMYSTSETPVTGVLTNIEYNTSPEDWLEGQGLGTTLVPQSLYEDQLDKRKLRENR